MPAQTRKNASSVSDFKKKPAPIELPSGNYISLRKTSLSVFIQSGQIPNGLMSIVQAKINSRKGISEEEAIAEILSDQKKLGEMFEMVDRYVCFVAVAPRVFPAPKSEDLRDEEILYVDEMDDGDKMFIFDLGIGGTADLATFREGSTSDVDPVQPRKGVGMQAKRASGRK